VNAPPTIWRVTATALVCALAWLLAQPASAELSAIEKHVVAAVDAEVERALELLQRTVDVNSGTMSFAGVREVGRLFAAELEELGFGSVIVR
jgi:glutamate carboxypeptidase